VAMLFLFYYQRELSRWFFPLRWMAAILLIAGPWYVLTAPAIETLSRNFEIRKELAYAEKKVERLTNSLEDYETNSLKRLKWAGRIDRTTKKLEAAEKERDAKLAAAKGIGFDWRLHVAAGVEGFVLFIVITTQLIAVGMLRKWKYLEEKSKNLSTKISKKVERNFENPAPEKSKSFEMDFEKMVYHVSKNLKALLKQPGITGAVLAEKYGFSQKNISLVINYEKGQQKEKISKKALLDMWEKLRVET